jgi:type II secretory pathway pseudopilin PulG
VPWRELRSAVGAWGTIEIWAGQQVVSACYLNWEVWMRRRGLTLVEVLTAAAVLVLLEGLLVPMLVTARERSKAATDVSNLRQLGQAAAIYAEGDAKRFPTSARMLADAGLVPKEIVVSSRDGSEDGLANLLISQNPSGMSSGVVSTAYKMSYVGPLEQGWPYEYFEAHILPTRGAGWLVNIVECKPLQGKYLAGATGRYQRLMLDGSVQNRVQHGITVEDDGKVVDGVHPILMYVDEGGRWIDERKL